MPRSPNFGHILNRLNLTEVAWLALLLCTLAVYLYGLGSPYAPTNGDEMVYVHIARMTAESGHWLPLQSELLGTRNTKPPLLIWQAIIAGNWGQDWNLWALRLPSVLYTFATTALLFFFAYQLSDKHQEKLRNACLASIVYLLFFSTFRYGRTYLTSAPETFWLALPMWWLLWLRIRDHNSHSGTRSTSGSSAPLGLRACTCIGVAFGLGCAYKSFALIAPAAAALWCAVCLSEPRLHWGVLWRTTLGVAWSALIGLAIFALWFVLDPEPGAVWQEFVLAENAGKMSGAAGYWHAALYGAYPMWTQLLAYPANAGLLALPVLSVYWLALVRAVRRTSWRQPSHAQWVLLAWLLVWLVVFTIPSQRSERYLIPAMPALALLMVLVWERLHRAYFWVTLLLCIAALVMLGRIGWVIGHSMQLAPSVAWTIGFFAITGGGVLAATAGLVQSTWTRNACLLTCLTVYASFGLIVAPLSTSEAGYSQAVQTHMQGKRIAVPNGFTGQYERFHFVLPGARLVPYDAEGRNTGALYPELARAQRIDKLLEEFDAVVWLQDTPKEVAPTCAPHCKILAQRWHVKSRHRSGEVTLDNLWNPAAWLFRKEWLLTPTARTP